MSADENTRAAVWYNGIVEATKRFKVGAVYDLSATPYYLHGSGYEAYTLFPWVATDFGLIEAIESGLVKIPFLPERDNTHNLEDPVLRNLYEHIRDELPKKGKAKQELAAHPQLPQKLVLALEQFYDHYERRREDYQTLFTHPPVFIIVCNNTSLSSEVFRHVAGYAYAGEEGEHPRIQNGRYRCFDNFHPDTQQPLDKPPTILIDSAALDDDHSAQISDDFKRVLSVEIDRFKADYHKIYPSRSGSPLTDADLLREVLNTVGKKGCLGEHIRCVVSVSMLTEGWDANTVTHICGVRAFGSQLLCEQVAGRALRRVSYQIQAFKLEPDGSSTQLIPADELEDFRINRPDEIIEKFGPEYAHIIGVPFRLFKGTTGPVPPPPKPNLHTIMALHDRAAYEIKFPNLLGYRMETQEGPLRADFSNVEPYELDGSRVPVETVMGNAFSDETQLLTLDGARDIRLQTIVYKCVRYMLKHNYFDNKDDGVPSLQLFPSLKEIVETWMETRLKCIHNAFPQMLVFEPERKVADHILKGVEAVQQAEGRLNITPVFNFYNKFGSTSHVLGNTQRKVYPTRHSHVNYVVADTDKWEQIAAKTLDELADEGHVLAYVKNAFLGFAIPYAALGGNHPEWKEAEQNQRLNDRYAEDHKAERDFGGHPLYYPDFIVKCKAPDGEIFHLILEITGMDRHKTQKRWYVQNRWLPAVNAVRDQYPELCDYGPWRFVEIIFDIRNISNQIRESIFGR